MGYADSLLTEGEYIVYRTRQHPLARLLGSRWGIVLAALGVVLFVLYVFFGWSRGGLGPLLGPATLILLVVGGALIAWSYVGWYNEDYMITSRRVIRLSGILGKNAADSSLEKVNDAILHQSLFGRLLDWGDLRILTASDIMDVEFRMLHHAVEFKKVMLMAKHDLETGIDRRQEGQRPPAADEGASPAPAAPPPAPVPAAPPPAPAAPAPPSAEDKLRSLAKLRDDGIITPEDYEAKKAEILGEM